MPCSSRALRILCCFGAAEDEDAEQSRQNRAETLSEKSPCQIQVEANEEHGGEIMEKEGMMGDGKGESEVQTPMRREEERKLIQNKTLTTRRNTVEVQNELPSVFVSEFNVPMGTVVFSQGFEGASSFIIWKGSVDVITQLWGNLSMVDGGDSGRLVLNEGTSHPNPILHHHDCNVLRVNNISAMTILTDVKVKTFQVEERGQLTLVMQKNFGLKMVLPKLKRSDNIRKFAVIAGTPTRLLDVLIGTMDMHSPCSDQVVPFMTDFLVTHLMYLPVEQLCSALFSYYQGVSVAGLEVPKGAVALRNRRLGIIQLVVEWAAIYGPILIGDPTVARFLEQLKIQVKSDPCAFPTFKTLLIEKYDGMRTNGFRPLFEHNDPPWFLSYDSNPRVRVRPIRALDEVDQQVYLPDHTSVHLMVPTNASGSDLMTALAKVYPVYGYRGDGEGRGRVLVKVNSSGERTQLVMETRGVATSLKLNEKLFLSPPGLVGKLSPANDQLGPVVSSIGALDRESPEDVTRHLTAYDWALFSTLHQSELLFSVVGQETHPLITTANLDRFLRRYNQVQYWVSTEIVLCDDLVKRAALISKFIEIATILRNMRNLHSFSAVLCGLTNSAVLRLHETWVRVPKKWMKEFHAHEKLLNPCKNYQAYRETLADLSPPYIPYTQVLLEDLALIHKSVGNNTDGLVNFDKMRMLGGVLKVLTHCRSQPYFLTSPKHSQKPPPGSGSLHHYLKNLHVISDQCRLMEFSWRLEPWGNKGDISEAE